MAPLQIILLLILVRLPRSLIHMAQTGEGGAAASVGFSDFQLPWHVPGWIAIGSFILTHLLLVGYVFARTHSALKILNHPNGSSVAVTARTDTLFQYARWATLALAAIHIFLLNLPSIIVPAVQSVPYLRWVPLIPEALYLLPGLLSWIAFWAAAYRVESANRERSLAYRFAEGLPAHPMPSRMQFLFMHMRHNFYILLPVGAASLVEELSILAEPWFPHAGEWGVILAFLCLLLMMPWFITRAWNTVPLKGPLRSELDGIAHLYRLRFRNILVWKTHNAITNAAILGYLPFSRYFLMTDALLETLTDQQIEAVFAHEVGHGVHRHIWWYMTGIAAAFLISTAGANLMLPWLPHAMSAEAKEGAGVIVSFGVFALFFVWGFPFVSHRFEHQADWFAARHMSRQKDLHPRAEPVIAANLVAPTEDAVMEPLTAMPAVTLDQYLAGNYPHSTPQALPQTSPAASAVATLPRPMRPGADSSEVFISALDTIADLAHRSRDKKGWMHPSINRRIELLRNLAGSVRAKKAFDRRMLRARLYVFALLLFGIGLTVYSATHPEPPAQKSPTVLHTNAK